MSGTTTTLQGILLPTDDDQRIGVPTVHRADAGEASDVWIRRAVGCQWFDVVGLFGRWDLWIDDEGALMADRRVNSLATFLIAESDRAAGYGYRGPIYGAALLVPTQPDGETRGFGAAELEHVDATIQAVAGVMRGRLG